MHVDKLDDILNEYNNTYQNGIKMKSADVKSRTYIDFDGEKRIKILNLKLVAMQKHQNIKILLQNITLKLVRRSFCD